MLTALKYVMIPCSPTGSYQHFKGIQYHHYCVNMEAVCSSEMSLPTNHNNSYLRRIQHRCKFYHYENLKSDDQIQFIMVCFPAAEAAAAARNFFLLQSIQICSGTHPASYSLSIIGTLPNSKEARYETDHLPPPSAMAKNKWSYAPLHIMTHIAKTYVK